MKINLLIVATVLLSAPLIAMAATSPSALDNVRLSNEQLMARISIEALCIEYFYLLDHGQSEKLAELFTDKGIQDNGDGKVYVGKEEIRKYYTARSSTRITRHVTTNLRLVFESNNRVRGTRTFTHYGADSPEPHPAIPSVAEYEEVFERDSDGQWRFASRKVTPIFSKLQQ